MQKGKKMLYNLNTRSKTIARDNKRYKELKCKIILKVLFLSVPRPNDMHDNHGSRTLARHVWEGLRCRFGGCSHDTAAITMVWYAIREVKQQ